MAKKDEKWTRGTMTREAGFESIFRRGTPRAKTVENMRGCKIFSKRKRFDARGERECELSVGNVNGFGRESRGVEKGESKKKRERGTRKDGGREGR